MRPKKTKSKLSLNKQTIANVNLALAKGGTEGTITQSYITPEYETGCACILTMQNVTCGCVSNGCGSNWYSCDPSCEEPF